MPKVLAAIESPVNANEIKAISLKGEINANHRECLRAGNETIHHAVSAGELLLQVKSLVPHGQFQKWVEQYCDFSHDVANGYMALQRQLSTFSKSERARILDNSGSVTSLKKLLKPKENDNQPPKRSPPSGFSTSEETAEKPPAAEPEIKTEPESEESPEVVAIREACNRHKVDATDSQVASLAENCEPEMVDAVIESVKLNRQTLDRAVEFCDLPEPTTEEACEDHNRKIESFCRDLTKWVKDNKPDVEYIDDAGRFDVLIQKVKNGCETVRTAKATICPACKGQGCKTCKSLGYLPKMVAAQVATEK